MKHQPVSNLYESSLHVLFQYWHYYTNDTQLPLDADGEPILGAAMETYRCSLAAKMATTFKDRKGHAKKSSVS